MVWQTKLKAGFLTVIQVLTFTATPVLAQQLCPCGEQEGCALVQPLTNPAGCLPKGSPLDPDYRMIYGIIAPILDISRSGCNTVIRVKPGSYNDSACATCFKVCCTTFFDGRPYTVNPPTEPTNTINVQVSGQDMTLPPGTTDANGVTTYTIPKNTFGLGRVKVDVGAIPAPGRVPTTGGTPAKTTFVGPKCDNEPARPREAACGVSKTANPTPCETGPQAKGDPVDEFTRSFIAGETDLTVNGMVPLRVVRQYDGKLNTTQGLFGNGMDLAVYNYRIIYPVDSGGAMNPLFLNSYDILDTGNGKRLAFLYVGNSTFVNDVELGTTGDKLTYTVNGSFNPTGAVYTTKHKDVFTFNASGYLTQIKDRNNNTVTLARDASNRLLTVTETTSNRSLSFTYNALGFIASVADHAGRTVTYGYDGTKLATVTNLLSQTIYYDWTPDNRIARKTDRKGVIAFQNTYDTNGNVTQQTDALGGIYRFDSLNDTDRQFTNPNGHASITRYNDWGVPVEETDALGHKTTTQYSESFFSKNTANRSLVETDALNRKTETAVNTLNLPTSVKDPLNQTVAMAYENTAQPDRVTKITDKKGNISTLAYDAAGNVTQATDPAGKTTQFVYNPRGQVTTVTNALNQVTTMSYATNGDLLSITDPLNRQTQLTYDPLGRLATVTDPKGNTTTYTYDALDRLTQVKNALNQTTQFAYDANDNLITRTDALGQVTTYTYDNKNRLTRTTNPLNQQQQTAYDPADRVTSTTDAKNQITTHTYDAVNRLTKLTFADGVAYTYAYDDADQLLSVGDGTGTWGFTYDLLGRTTQIQEPGGNISYTYDANNNRTSLTGHGSYGSVSYTYDNRDLLTGVTQNTQNFTYSRDALGRVTGLNRPNAVNTTYAYDTAGQITDMRTRKNNTGADLDRQQYTYDPAGNILSWNTRRYKYDALNRLIEQSTVPTTDTWQYGFDAVGNLTSKVQIKALPPSVTTTYTVNAADRLTRRLVGTTQTLLNYDNNGNLITFGTKSYTWNARNQLASYKATSTGAPVVFAYDVFGRRIQNGTKTGILYDGINLITDGSSKFLNSPALDDQLSVTTNANVTLNYVKDHLGSVTRLTNSTGANAHSYSYNAYGARTSTNPQPANPITYTGREEDTTGLLYLRNRYYDPAIERFISDDPMGDGQRYVLGNPLSYIDSLGLDAILVDFHGFPVTVGNINGGKIKIPLGHAGVVSINPKNGATRFYQFGRYDGTCGKVRRESIPDLKIGKNGRPTQESLNSLYKFLSEHHGEGVPVTGEYYPNADYKKINNYAEKTMQNPGCWSVPGHTCRDFAESAIDAAK